MHTNSHPLAGKTVKIREGVKDPGQNLVLPGSEYRIEDWWDKLTGKSWMVSKGNIAAMQYGIRIAFNNVPLDDEVVYGKIDGLGHLVHVSEIVETNGS